MNKKINKKVCEKVIISDGNKIIEVSTKAYEIIYKKHGFKICDNKEVPDTNIKQEIKPKKKPKAE